MIYLSQDILDLKICFNIYVGSTVSKLYFINIIKEMNACCQTKKQNLEQIYSIAGRAPHLNTANSGSILRAPYEHLNSPLVQSWLWSPNKTKQKHRKENVPCRNKFYKYVYMSSCVNILLQVQISLFSGCRSLWILISFEL